MATPETATPSPTIEDATTRTNGGALMVRESALPATPSVDWLNKTLSPGQIETLVKTVAPGATPDELAVFFWSARRRGLDPFLKQVHFVKRRRSVKKDDGSWGYEEYAVHQTGIDGLRVIAHRAKDADGKKLLAGIKRGPLKDANGKLIGAWAEIYRHDWTEPARAEVDFDEYCQYVERQGKSVPAGLWATKPQTMIEKCAEAAAERMAFPEDMADLYIHEEMDNAEHVKPREREEPAPLTSTAAAASAPVVVEGEVISTAAATASANPTTAGTLFADDVEEPALDPRAELIAKIIEARDSFKPPPRPTTWERICIELCTTQELEKVDPSALSDLLTFLTKLKTGDGDAVARMRKISPAPAPVKKS